MTTSPAPSRSPLAAIRRPPAWVFDGLWLALLAIYLFSGLARIPLHGDEASYLWMSRDFEHIALRPNLSALTYDPDAGDPDAAKLNLYRILNGPLPRTSIGLAWWAAGFRPADLPQHDWSWDLSPEQNAAAGNLPAARLLLAGRAAATAWLVIGLIGLFWLGRTLGGRRLAYCATALYAMNPLLLLNARRAMAEGPLVGTTLLALAAASAYILSPPLPSVGADGCPPYGPPYARGRGVGPSPGVRGKAPRLALIGALAGLAFSAKLNGALTLAIVAAAVALHGAQQGAGVRRIWETVWRVGIVAAAALAISVALAPAYWADPVGAAKAMWAQRDFLTGAHAWTHGGYESPAERTAALVEAALAPVPQYFDLSAWAGYLIGDIRAYRGSLSSGLPATPLIHAALGGLAILGLGALLVDLFEARDSYRRNVAALILLWAALTLGATYALIPLPWQRYYVPVVPVMVFLQAFGLAWASGRVKAPTTRASLVREWLPTLATAAVIGIGVLMLQRWAHDHIERPARLMHFEDSVLVGTPLGITFGDQVTLIGINQSGDAIRSGEVVHLTLWWRLAGGPIADEYAAIVALHDAAGQPIAQVNSGYEINFQTSSWVPGTVIEERLALRVPPGTPPGDASLHVSLFAPRSDAVPQANIEGAAPTANPQIASVRITRPRHPADPASLDLTTSLNRPVAPGIDLIGVAMEPAANDVGQPFFLILGWAAFGDPSSAMGSLLWMDETGQERAWQNLELVPGYPTDQWHSGDIWRSVRVLHVPGSLETGTYTLKLRLFGPMGQRLGNLVDIGSMAVSAPPRSFDPPDPQHVAGIEWANGIRLLGFDLPAPPIAPGSSAHLTFYWQPQDELNHNLTLFVHLIDGQGNIVAQRDQIPLGGARPTMGWAPGEVVTGSLDLSIGAGVPPGDYSIRIGWYDAQTGERILLAEGGDFTILAEPLAVQP